MRYQQGFGILTKAKYCPMVGGNIKELAKDLEQNLSGTPIGNDLNIHFLGDEKLVIKGNLPSSGFRRFLRNASRKIRDIKKPEYGKVSDFHMVVSIDERGADLNLYDSEKWKDPIYGIVLETLRCEEKN